MAASTLTTIKQELLSFKAILIILSISFLYILLTVLALNYNLLAGTFSGNFSLAFKLQLTGILIKGLTSAMAPLDLLLLIISAILVGINFYLMAKTIYQLEHSKKVRFSIGGAAIISFATTGCASCGLSLLSILGLSASLSFLPFHGMELHIASILLLIFSAWYMLKQLNKAESCEIITTDKNLK